LLVGLREHGGGRLLEDLVPDEGGRIFGHIGVGDARLGGGRDIGDG
jgi:hypothetical protein